MDEILTSSFKDFLAEIMLTTDKKQIECFANAKTLSITNEDTINALVETLDAKEQVSINLFNGNLHATNNFKILLTYFVARKWRKTWLN